MSNVSRLERILNKSAPELKGLRIKSMKWFDAKVQDMSRYTNVTPQNLMRGDQNRKSNTIQPGNLYMYIYDPKHKVTLPYYDTFPLVFPFNIAKKGEKVVGFYGINMHYLPYWYRARLMGRLMDFKTDKRYDENTKLKLQWSFLDGVSRYSLVLPCVKMYLYDHVRTPFKRVEAKHWDAAMLLPVEQFQKASPQQVWAESMKTAKRGW